MSRTYEAQDAAERYDAARRLPEATLALWMDTLKRHVFSPSVDSILDLGAGTGIWSALLGQRYNAGVVALEPSEAMREIGGRHASHRVMWLKGIAERIPTSGASFSLVWMSQVFHHLDNRAAALQEIRRVLKPRGFLAIRNATRENDDETGWFACFPEARQLDRSRIPLRNEVVELVCAEGFKVLAIETVHQQTAPDYATFYERISRRALSVMMSISDEAFETGLRRLKAWTELQPADIPVVEPLDLFVFQAV